MKYKHLIYAVIFGLMLLASPTTAQAAYGLYHEGRYDNTDSSMTISVGVDNDTQYYGFQFDIRIPMGLSFQTDADNDVVVSLSERLEGFTIVSKLIEPYTLRIAGFSTTHTAIKGNSGTILTFPVILEKYASVLYDEVFFSNLSFVSEDDKEEEQFYIESGKLTFLTEGSLDIPNFSISSNREKKVPVLFDFSGKVNYVNFTIEVPDGIDLEIDKSNPNSIYIDHTKEGSENYFSIDFEDFISNEHVMDIVVKAGDNAATQSEMKIKDIYIVTPALDIRYSLQPSACKVTTSKSLVENISLNHSSLNMQLGDQSKLEAAVTPDDAGNNAITWESENTSVARVDSDGTVYAVGIGKTTVIAAATDGSGVKAECEITVSPVAVTSVILNHESAQLQAGETLTLKATVLPESVADKTVVWASSNEAVASVDYDGNVLAKSPGEVIITASCGEKTATCKVKVLAVPVSGIKLSHESARLKVGEQVTVTAEVLPSHATDKSVVWRSSDNDIASVDSKGSIFAVSPGEAIISATCGQKTATCIVTVMPVPVESITLSAPTAQLKAGDTMSLTATILPENATDKSMVWTSSNSEVASVDESGNVSAKTPGVATITATSGAVSATCEVTVVAIPVEIVTLNFQSAQLKIGETLTLTANVKPDNATDKTLTWTSSNNVIATVDAIGNVTAKSLGEATITTTCGEISASCAITVIPVPVESITLHLQNTRLIIGQSIMLTTTVLPENATNKTVSWSTSDETVATVEQSGMVTAIKPGTVTITATADDDSGIKAEATVEVIEENTPIIIEATYNFTTPGKLTPAQEVNTSNSPVCEINNVVFKEKEINLIASGGGTTPRLWYNSSSGIQLRVYNGATLTIQCDEAYEINEVEFAGNQLDALSIGGSPLGNSTSFKYVVQDAGNKLTFNCVTNGSHKRADISAITVRYQKIHNNTPIPAESVIISSTECELTVGDMIQLSATVLPENTTDKTISWSSSNEDVTVVDTNGNITAVGVGTARIMATCGTATAICEVTVMPILVETISITPTVISGVPGDYVKLEATVLPENATDKSLTWQSTDETVATVNDEGVVYIHAVGTCVITATAKDGSGVKAQCEISGVSGIEEILEDSESKVDVYNLRGELLMRGCDKAGLKLLQHGLYIVRTENGSVIKIIVK